MSQSKTIQSGRDWILYNPDLMPEPELNLFNCKQLQQQGLLTGQAAGRGETCFYRYSNSVWALRHYLRGGLIAKFLKDAYLGISLEKTRAWQEWKLLEKMTAMDLPVPTPVAARVKFKAFFYTADLITVFIENTTTLADKLQQEKISDQLWFELGKTIRRFHDNQIFHSDLNARNILLDENNKIYLIDFDRCGLKQGQDWKQENLDRFLRSLNKFKSKSTCFYFEDNNWKSLLSAYQQ